MSASPAPTDPRLWTSALMRILGIDLLMMTGAHALIPVVALYLSSLGHTEALVGIVASVFMLSSIIARPFAGLAVDALGQKRVLVASILLIVAAGAVLPFELGLTVLVLMRCVQGLGWAAYTPAANTMMAELVPFRRRGEGMGYASTVRNGGLAVGSALGLLLAARGLYAMAFAVGFAMTGAALIIAMRCTWPVQAQSRGQVWSVRGLIEWQSVSPSLVSATMTFVMGGFVTFIPLDAQRRDLGSAVVFFVVFAVVLMVVRPLAGRLSDRAQSRGTLVIPGLLLTAASACILAFTEGPLTLWLAAITWGIGFGTAQPALRAMVLDRVPQARWGAANATSMILYELGGAVGSFVLGMVASRLGTPVMFAISSVAPLLAILFMLMTGLHRERLAETEGSTGNPPLHTD